MKIKLTPDDRGAIDLLLDQAVAASSAPAHHPSHHYAAGAGTAHVQAVRRVLHLLDALPAFEASTDLASRTLTHIAHATGEAAAANVGAGHFLVQQVAPQLSPQMTLDGQPHRPA